MDAESAGVGVALRGNGDPAGPVIRRGGRVAGLVSGVHKTARLPAVAAVAGRGRAASWHGERVSGPPIESGFSVDGSA